MVAEVSMLSRSPGTVSARRGVRFEAVLAEFLALQIAPNDEFDGWRSIGRFHSSTAANTYKSRLRTGKLAMPPQVGFEFEFCTRTSDVPAPFKSELFVRRKV